MINKYKNNKLLHYHLFCEIPQKIMTLVVDRYFKFEYYQLELYNFYFVCGFLFNLIAFRTGVANCIITCIPLTCSFNTNILIKEKCRYYIFFKI